ncbi:MAG TPA: hypothetical protein VFN49_11100 [Candidatus Aquilonibacter sp.]|nr:hypothetical protein [Candidatus Aquilonibacter sp.]
MNYDSDDALDRALFALPLEEPPADLRAAILTATVYRPAPLFKPWELAVLGTLAAIVTWLVVLVIMSGGTLAMHSVQAIGSAIESAFSNYATLAWVAAGGGAAIWLSLFTGFQPSTKGVSAQRR